MAEFITLAELLRPPAASATTIADAADVADGDVTAFDDMNATASMRDAVRDAVRDARLFRARLADAFDAALARLLHDVAVAVVARDLALASADLAAIVQRVRAETPYVRVRCAAADAAALHAAFGGDALVVDARLLPGDLEFELAGGMLDARLGTRLACALDASAAPDAPR